MVIDQDHLATLTLTPILCFYRQRVLLGLPDRAAGQHQQPDRRAEPLVRPQPHRLWGELMAHFNDNDNLEAIKLADRQSSLYRILLSIPTSP